MAFTHGAGPVSMHNVVLQLDEIQITPSGEGITRAVAGKSTQEYRLLVRSPYAPPMRVVLFAEGKKKAVMYAQNRWPDASVQLLE